MYRNYTSFIIIFLSNYFFTFILNRITTINKHNVTEKIMQDMLENRLSPLDVNCRSLESLTFELNALLSDDDSFIH